MLAGSLALFEEASLVDISGGGRDEKDGDIYPIGGLADSAVVGVEEYGNKQKTEDHAPKLNAPEVGSITEEKALRNGESKHRPK